MDKNKLLNLLPVKIGFNPTWLSKKKTQKRSWSELHSFFNEMASGGAGKNTIRSQMAEYRSWIYIATSAIYRRIGAIDYKYYRNDTDEEIERGSLVYNAISKIFVDPNPFMEYRFMKQWWQLQLDLTGRAFGLVEVDTTFGLPENIWPLNVNDFVRIELGKTFRNYIKGYTFNIGGKYVTYRPENILHFHYPHPEDPRIGCSPVQAQAYVADIDHYIEVYERDFFKNSARFDFAVSYPEEVSIEQDDIDRLKEQWKKKFSGEGHFHEVAILDKGATLKELSPKNEDLALLFLADWSMAKLLATYGVPAGKVGLVKDVNKANAEGIDVTFNSECIKPRLMLHDEVVTRGVLQKFDVRLEMRHDNPVPRDRKLDIEEIKIKVGVPTWTINEGRKRDNLPPDPNGDVIVIPMNHMPLSMMLGEGGVAPDVEEEDDEEEEKGFIEGDVTEVKQLPEETGKKVVGKDTEEDWDYTEEWKQVRWNAFKIYTEAWESIWRSNLVPLFSDQKEEVLQNLERVVDKNKSIGLLFGKENEILDGFTKRWDAHRRRYWYSGSTWTIKRIAADIESNFESLSKMLVVRDDGLIRIAVDGLIRDLPLEEVSDSVEQYIVTKQGESLDSVLFDWDRNVSAFDRLGKKLSGQILLESARESMTSLGVDATFRLDNPRAKKFLGNKVQAFSDSVLSTKSNQLRSALRDGFKKGEGIRKLSDRVSGVYDQVLTGKYEATRIARTEVIAASNEGSALGYGESGVVEDKGWLSTRDMRTRGSDPKDSADHLHMDGQRVPLDQPFIDPRSSARMMQPGDASLGAKSSDIVLCRCTLVPYTKKAKSRSSDAGQKDIDRFRRETGQRGVGRSRMKRGINTCMLSDTKIPDSAVEKFTKWRKSRSWNEAKSQFKHKYNVDNIIKKGYTSQNFPLDRMNDIGKDLGDVLERKPKLADVLGGKGMGRNRLKKIRIHNTDRLTGGDVKSKYLGTYSGWNREIDLATKLDYTSVYPPSVGTGKWTVEKTFLGNWRHELGHHVDGYLSLKDKKKWTGIWEYLGKGPGARAMVSRYAATNPAELFAESFCAYVNPKYKVGSLPSNIEDFMKSILD